LILLTLSIEKEEFNMFGIGSQELMIILLIAFFIFGAKRLPELGKSLGQSIRGFKSAMEGRAEIEEKPTQNQGSENTAKKIP
jgi:sec-independent protein translocase protein TatA